VDQPKSGTDYCDLTRRKNNRVGRAEKCKIKNSRYEKKKKPDINKRGAKQIFCPLLVGFCTFFYGGKKHTKKKNTTNIEENVYKITFCTQHAKGSSANIEKTQKPSLNSSPVHYFCWLVFY